MGLHNQSVKRAFSLLNAFDGPHEWLANSELARRANLPGPSCYRLVQTLLEIGAVTRNSRGKYRLGMLLVSLSYNVIVGDVLREVSEQITAELSSKLNVTVHLGILEDEMVTYVVKATTHTSFAAHTRVGTQLECYCSALGKVLLADLPPAQCEAAISGDELIPLTPQTITDRKVLRDQLEVVRRVGYALDDRESQIDTCCVAVPVRDRNGHTIAALSATEAAAKMTHERRAALLAGLVEASAALTAKISPNAGGIKSVVESGIALAGHQDIMSRRRVNRKFAPSQRSESVAISSCEY